MSKVCCGPVPAAGWIVSKGNRFVRLESVPRDGVVALAGGHSLRLFVSNDESGFFYVKDKTAVGFPLDASRAVDCYLTETGRREAWFGTLGSGLLRWKKRCRQPHPRQRRSLRQPYLQYSARR